MAAPHPPPPPTPADLATGRAITHAVYLTGGLIMLAFAILQFTSAFSELAQCALNTAACIGNQIYWNVAPTFGAGAVLLGVAVVLFVFAQRTR